MIRDGRASKAERRGIKQTDRCLYLNFQAVLQSSPRPFDTGNGCHVLCSRRCASGVVLVPPAPHRSTTERLPSRPAYDPSFGKHTSSKYLPSHSHPTHQDLHFLDASIRPSSQVPRMGTDIWFCILVDARHKGHDRLVQRPGCKGLAR